jgi:hypothetical protein
VGNPCVAGSVGGAKRGWSSGSKNTSAGVGDDWRVLYVARWVWIFGWNGVRELDGWRTSGIVQTESESESVVSYVVCSFALVCGTIHSDHCKEKDDALILVEFMFVVSRDALDRHETLRSPRACSLQHGITIDSQGESIHTDKAQIRTLVRGRTGGRMKSIGRVDWMFTASHFKFTPPRL